MKIKSTILILGVILLCSVALILISVYELSGNLLIQSILIFLIILSYISVVIITLGKNNGRGEEEE